MSFVNSGNMFSALALSNSMAESLPKDVSNEIRNPYDAIALLSHACMLAVGFRLIGLGEDHKLEAPSDPENPQPLPVEWKACSPSNPNYAFRYAHTQSALEYLVKVSRLGSKAVINGLGIGDEKVHTLDIVTKDFVSISSLPYTIPPSAGINETALALRQIFISAGRLTDLGTFFKLQVIQKLAPSLRKAGHEDSAHAASHSPSNPQQREEQERQDNPARRPEDPPTHDPLRDPTLPAPARPYPLHDPLAAGPPRRPHPAGDFPPPGFEDEYEINRPPRGGIGGPERRPLNIGERDLYPQGLGPNDPFRGGGGVGPGLGGMGGGGMHPTFDDPIFGDRGGFGGAGYDPQAPPGARYDDPFGPRPPRGPGGGGGARGGPYNPFGGFGGNDFI